ncbi:hypothetical protein MBLNU230_g4047t1 [Neophaeotheca triangularis]
MRPENKEPQPEWSSICNNVFDQYLDGDDPFDFDAVTHERSSSNDSSALFNFSGGSEQSNVTGGTSPIPAWGESVVQSIEAPDGQAARLQPEPKAPVDFWARTLKALEQNAAASEKQQRQQVLRTAKSHPDFLSLGGHPSPPAIPVSTPSQTLSVQRQRHRMPAGATSNRNTTRQPSAVRSVSRGRPLGVAKTGGSSSNRKISLSPTKMMTPSRYRAASRTGFRDVWAQRVVSGMDKHDIRVPTLMHQGLPVSPPHSGHLMQEDEFAVFGSPERGYAGNGYYEDQMSPLAVNFQQQARLHTPARSPMLSPRSRDVDGYFVEAVPQIPPNPYMPRTVPLNDTTPLYPERTSSLAPNRLQAFDFGFSSPHEELDAWGAASFSEPTSHPYYHREHFSQQADPFVGAENPVPGSPVFESAGLGISCDPSLVSNFTAVTNNSSVPTEMYQPPQALMTPYHIPTQASKTEPNTPHNRRRRHARSRSYADSPSPSPTPTAPRSRQRSSSRRAVSRHRRTKSSTVTPRQAQNGASSQQGGFVNYTPNDKGKILNGVAPSGSSKTKARREKEAADKRRKFSQAAAQAVLELGGDLDSLAKAGLLAS